MSLYHRLIELCRAEAALSVGEFAPVPADDDLMAYVRKAGDRRLLIVLNLGAKIQSFSISDLQCRASLLFSTYLDRTQEKLEDKVELRGDKGVIIELL
jgi:alpha-glucosidase